MDMLSQISMMRTAQKYNTKKNAQKEFELMLKKQGIEVVDL